MRKKHISAFLAVAMSCFYIMSGVVSSESINESDNFKSELSSIVMEYCQ